jgi:hypothetical protein
MLVSVVWLPQRKPQDCGSKVTPRAEMALLNVVGPTGRACLRAHAEEIDVFTLPIVTVVLTAELFSELAQGSQSCSGMDLVL